MAAVVVVVAEVVEDHDDNHQYGVTDGENVERGPSDILGLNRDNERCILCLMGENIPSRRTRDIP